MRNLISVAFVAVFAMLLMAGCGHNVSTIGIGTGFRAGGSGYGINYGEGLFGTFVTKDGIKFKAEIDSTTDRPTATRESAPSNTAFLHR